MQALRARDGSLPPVLTAITPGTLKKHEFAAFCRAAAPVCATGLSGILVREPDLGDRAVGVLCKAMRAAAGRSVWIALHDRVHLAPSADVDAVHLGFRSLPPVEARALLPADVSVGYSAHAGDTDAARNGADYLIYGPVFDTPSKRGMRKQVGFDGLASAVASTTLPVYAIGGLKPEHAGRVRTSGARGIVVLSGVFGAQDPALAVQRYLDAWSA